MARIDENFIAICTDIIENGTTTEGQQVRPHWPDGTPAYTIKKFGVVTRYDLSKEYPVLTLRKTPVKSSLDELLWIWQQKSNNIHELHSGVWDEWADEQGTIGTAYGYQMALKHKYRDIKPEGLVKAFGDSVVPTAVNYVGEALRGGKTLGEEALEDIDIVLQGGEPKDAEGRGYVIRDGGNILYPVSKEYKKAHAVLAEDGCYYMDQVDRVIYDLKNNPFSRRILTSIYTYSDLREMHLHPCAYSMTFNVTQKPGSDKLTLNGILNQRSQDTLAAFAWNEWQYAILIGLLAQVCDMEAGEFMHIVADCHIYDRHVDAIKELIGRTPKAAPKVVINPDIHDFYAFTRDDVTLEGYEVAGDQIRNIEIAI